MISSPRVLLMTGVALLALSSGVVAQAEETVSTVDAGAVENQVDCVVVTGARTRTSAVTGLDMSLRETPQSVTILDQARIQNFGLTTVNDLLAQVTGVNVEKVETDRTYYNSRGFDITNFQVDGIGLPLIWGIQFGDLDTVLFDRVEVVRGANSMMTGTGNPSATVNYVRKRPTDTFKATAALQYGSWDDYRLEADVSGPLNAAGTVRGRLIYANEDKGSYLDHYHVNRNVYSALLAWDVTPKLTATAGYALQDNRSRGVLWGALPLLYADGTTVDYPRSASTSADWTYWNVKDQTAFTELDYRFDNGWQVKATGTYKRFNENAKLLYAYGNPDPATGLGVKGMSGIYPSKYENFILDAYASGPFQLFGRTHQLVVGGQTSKSTGKEWENFALDSAIPYPAIGLWDSQQVAEPTYPGAYQASDQTDRLSRFYAAAHFSVTDQFKVVAGFNALKLKSKGYSYGADTPRDEKKVSPYVGAVYDLTPNVSLYASYTDIFNPQSERDIDNQNLPAAHGEAYEAGVKSEWFDHRLYVTGAVFQSEQKDLAFAVGMDGTRTVYDGLDTKVTGYELEATGALTDQWTLSAGWTQLKIEGEDGQDREYLPRKTFKATTTYTFPDLRNLTIGAAARWQSAVSMVDIAPVEQKAYGVVDLMAGVDLTDKVRATLNVDNAANKRYLTSLMWTQSYYAAPRSVSLRLAYAF